LKALLIGPGPVSAGDRRILPGDVRFVSPLAVELTCVEYRVVGNRRTGSTTFGKTSQEIVAKAFKHV